MMQETLDKLMKLRRQMSDDELDIIMDLRLRDGWDLELAEDFQDKILQMAAKYGLVADTENEVVEMTSDSAPSPLPALAEALPVEGVENIATTNGPPALPSPATSKLQQAGNLAREGNFSGAIKVLTDLQADASVTEAEQEEIRSLLSDFTFQLAEIVKPLIEEAEAYAYAHEAEKQGQRGRWEKVLEVDPANIRANSALAAFGESEAVQNMRDRISRMQQSTAEARQKNDLKVLRDNQAKVEEFREGQRFPTLQFALTELNEQIKDAYDHVRRELGIATTLLLEGDYKHAYIEAYKLLDKGASEIIDEDGSLMVDESGEVGVAGAFVNIADYVDRVSQQYRSSLLSNVSGKEEAAERQSKSNPELAQSTLKQALRLVTGEELNFKDRTILKDDKERLEQKIDGLESEIEIYNQAKEMVLDARDRERSAEDRLDLLRDAKKTFPLTDIDSDIELVEEELARSKRADIRTAMSQARMQAAQFNFDEAILILQKVREEVEGLRETPELREAKEDLNVYEIELENSYNEYKILTDVLTKVDGLLGQVAESEDEDALREAKLQIEALTEDQKLHPETRSRVVRLSTFQTTAENERQGTNAYRERNWEVAISLLGNVVQKLSGSDAGHEIGAMHGRAQAALLEFEAGKAETDLDWTLALNKYNRAEELIKEFGEDDLTLGLGRRIDEKLEALKPLQANDAKLSDALKEGESLLEQAELIIHDRMANDPIFDQLLPLPQFAEAFKTLNAVAGLKTSKELQLALQKGQRQVRQVWRTTYLELMDRALQKRDKDLAERAITLGEELEAHSLLSDSAHKQLLIQLKQTQLDQTYVELLKNPGTNGIEIEKNRGERLAIATLSETKEITNQYRTAVEDRVRRELDERVRKDAKAAYQYLKKELDSVQVLYDSIPLFSELFHLCWANHYWREARQEARSLGFRTLSHADLYSRMWTALTDGAEVLISKGKASFEAELETVKEKLRQQPAVFTLFGQEQDWITDWRVNELLEEISRDGEQNDIDIDAAVLFARAYELNPLDPRVTKGLESIGSRVQDSLPGYLDDVREFSPQADLSSTIREITEQENYLIAIHEVASALDLEKGIQREMEDVTAFLTSQRKRYQDVERDIKRWERDFRKALVNPGYGANSGSFGWTFKSVRDRLGQMKGKYSDESFLRNILRKMDDDLMTKTRTAEAVHQKVHQLHDLLESETFSEIPKVADDLQYAWALAEGLGFDGFRNLIEYSFPFPIPRKTVSTLDDINREAERREGNQTAWMHYLGKVEKSYREISSLFEELDEELPDLKNDKSLDEIIAESAEIERRSEHFFEVLKEVPDDEPQSRKAIEYESQIIDKQYKVKVLTGSDAIINRAKKLREEAELQLINYEEKYEKLLRQYDNLNVAFEKHVSSQQKWVGRKIGFPNKPLEQTEKLLKQCKNIDPKNTELLPIVTKVNDIKRASM